MRDVAEKQRSHLTEVEGPVDDGDAPPVGAEHALAAGVDSRAVVLVEGISDQVALETLAARRGRNLEAEGVAVVPIGGAQAIRRALERFAGLTLAGLCDAGEEGDFRRALERAGLGADLTRSE